MRPATLRVSALLVLLTAVAGSGARVAAGRATEARRAHADSLVSEATAERRRRDREVAFYEHRLTEDPRSALDLAQLAGLYLRRARDLGDETDLRRAEDAARRSLAERENRNGRSYVLLADALLAEHRFVEARAAAERAVARDPEEPAYRALLGETQLELGDYDAARRTLAPLWAQRWHLSVGPRLVRWQEVAGHARTAGWLARALRDSALRRTDLPGEQLAWFQLRVGDLDARAGRLDDAAAAYERGLRAAPDDRRLLAALARTEGARGDWPRAARLADSALAAGPPDPATLGLLSDAWRAMGDTAQAASWARAVEATAFASDAPLHRAWALFLLDHGRRVPEVLARAEAELATRRDVYGWDLYAWALHRAGRDAEAGRAMRQALRLGTEDVALHAHARAICVALRHEEAACRSS